MSKRVWAAGLCLAIILGLCGASADSWSGSVEALETVYVTAPAKGILEALALETGAAAEEGETVGSVRMEKVFAPFDGTVTVLEAEEGGEVSGTVLEITPVSLFTVSCTVSGAAKTPENAVVHIGETLWIRCMADRTHWAEAKVVSVSGSEFTAETVAGELYIGEAVFLYRNEDCLAGSRVGKGTVTARDPLPVAAEGVIRQLRVQVGDRVERGQWLFTVSSSADNDITVPASGIVTKVSASAGMQAEEGQELAEIAVSCAIRITASGDEADLFTADREWVYIRGDDPHEETRPCRVGRILAGGEDGSVTVEFIPEDETLLPVGMSVRVADVY